MNLLFSSPHCLLDPSSGAAVSTRDLLEQLAGRGWTCGAFCGSRTDVIQGRSRNAECRSEMQEWRGRVGGCDVAVHHCTENGVRVSIFDMPAPSPPTPLPPGARGEVFLQIFERVLDEFRPDVLLTYGGDGRRRPGGPKSCCRASRSS